MSFFEQIVSHPRLMFTHACPLMAESQISRFWPRYICTNAAQSTFSPVGSMTFSLTTFPYFEKTSVLFRLCSVAGIPEGPWEVNSTKLEVRDSKWKSSKPSSTTIDGMKMKQHAQKKKNQKRTERKNRCKKKRKLRSWLVKPTSQQKGHRRSGSFDVDVVAQVFNVVHFLMLHAQVLGSKIVDSRIGPCLKWPKYPKPATFRSSFLTFLVLCSDPT